MTKEVPQKISKFSFILAIRLLLKALSISIFSVALGLLLFPETLPLHCTQLFIHWKLSSAH